MVLSLILFDGTLEDQCIKKYGVPDFIVKLHLHKREGLYANIRWFLLHRNHSSHNNPQVDGNK